MIRILGWAMLAVLLIGGLAGCRISAEPTPTPGIDLDITLEAGPLSVGQTMLIITLKDPAGQPVNDAQIEVRGDMTHAGMMPVMRSALDGTDGHYEVPFEWTMAGDWFVVVAARLPDGRSDTARFEYRIEAHP